MITYTISSDQLAEEDIYDIQPVSSLVEFLKPHHSLCVVKTPYDGIIGEMVRVTGKNRYGEPIRVYLDSCPENNQGYRKSQLDMLLRSPYLFISWKQRGYHIFSMVRKRRIIAEFPDFPSALDAYFPDGFIPEKSYRRAQTIFELMGMAIRRKKLFEDLVTVLSRSIARRREMEGK